MFSIIAKKTQYIKKFFDLNLIKSINEELRKSGSLLGNNRERPKKKNKFEHSREINKKKLSDKNLEFLRRSFNKSDYEDFNDQREKIIRNRTLEPYRLEKIIKKLKFPYIDSEIEYNSYIVFNGKKIRKAYSMRNKDFIALANSINSLIYSESINDDFDIKSFNQRIKFNNNYDENINIKKYYYENIPILKKTNEEGKYIFRTDLPSKDKINDLNQINKTINISSDNSTKQDFSSIHNRRKNLNENIFEDNESSSSDDDLNNRKKLIKKDIIIINNSITGEKELINYNDGKKINDIKLNINEDGEEILVNKETGKQIDMYNYNIDPKTGKKIFSIFEEKKKKNKTKIKVFNENESNSFETITTSKKKIIIKIKIILNMNV